MQQPELKILLLEDVHADAEITLRVLKKAGLDFQFERVSDQETYLTALDGFCPDVILSDYSLPHFTGLEAFMIARQFDPTMPFLLVTGALPEATVIEIVKAGIDDYILKDNLSRLPGALQNAYDRRSAERKNRRLNELRKQFIMIMAHQLRTPLTGVSWNLEAVLNSKSAALSAATRQPLEVAYESNQKLIARIDDLLTIINIEEDNQPLKKQKVTLDELVKPIMDKIAKTAQASGLQFTYHPPAKRIPGGMLDPEKMALVVQKLSENAVTYTPQGGTITATLKATKHGARFEITDTGVGVPGADQHNLFTAFTRASNASVMIPDASGVGLAIAKYFVEKHDGSIGFESSEGKGSTFWFELPLKSQHSIFHKRRA